MGTGNDRQGAGQVRERVQQQPDADNERESGHQPGRSQRRRILPVRGLQRRRQQHQRPHLSQRPSLVFIFFFILDPIIFKFFFKFFLNFFFKFLNFLFIYLKLVFIVIKIR